MNITQILSSNQLSLLRKLFPISGLIHIGAGTGAVTSVYKEWGIPNALLVEADPHLFSQLESKTAGVEGWCSLQAVVSEQATQASFYQSNNPHEHGLIEPEKLTAFWRNLKTVEVQTADTQTLANILPVTGVNSPDTSPYNWLIVDCLPAIRILEGIGSYLGQVDVIIARAVLSPDDSLLPAGKTRIDNLLQFHGYQSIQVYEENHPAIGQVLYVRDHKTSVRNQRQSLIALQQHNQQLALEKDNAEQDNNACRQQIDALQLHNQQLAFEKDNAEQDNNACRQQIDALQLHNQQLALEKDNAEQDNNACRQQIDALQQHNQQLALEKDNAEHANSNYLPQLDSLQQQLAEIQQSKQQLETSHAEMVREYNLLQDEFVKAEAQVELIRELLRRELNESSEHIIHEA